MTKRVPGGLSRERWSDMAVVSSLAVHAPFREEVRGVEFGRFGTPW